MRRSLAALPFVIACAGEQPPTWHQDTAPIARAYCADCHGEGGIAPFELTEASDYRGLAPLVRATLVERTMPPFFAARGHTALRYDMSLSDEQLQLMLDWLDAGAPEGDPTNPAPDIELRRPGLDRYDIELVPAEPYTPQAEPDEYRCFVLDWPEDEPTYVTGFEVLPGNMRLTHHAVAYAIPPGQVSKLAEFEAMDEGYGYSCYGSAAQTDWEPANLTEQLVQIYLGAWTPGATGLGFPNGQRVRPGSKIVLQVHYFTLGDPGASDLTTFRLRVDPDAPQEAWYMPWMDLRWPGGGQMLIPEGGRFTHSFEGEPVGSTNLNVFASDADLSEGMLLHSVYAHMHLLGRELDYTLIRADGSEQKLLRIENYSFDWQQEYVFDEPVEVLPGDRLRIDCTFDNSAAWRDRMGLGEPVMVDWGEGSMDEMCVAHTRVTQR